MTRNEIIERAAFYFNAQVATSIPAARWVEAFNIAYQQMGVEAKCFPFSYSTDLVDSQRLYLVPTYVLEIRPGGVVTHEGELIGPVSLDLLADEDRNWQTTEGTPTRWYMAEQTTTENEGVENWAIGLYPVPPANDTNGLTLMGYRTPAALTAGTSVPPLPAHVHDCFCWGTCYLVALREAQGAPGKAGALPFFLGRYQEAIRQLRAARSTIGAKLWVLGGAAPGQAVDEIESAPFRVKVTSA